MEKNGIKIQEVNSTGKSFLKLEGTVLIYSNTILGHETCVWAPLELVQVKEKIAHKKSRLLATFLTLILVMITGLIVNGIRTDNMTFDNKVFNIFFDIFWILCFCISIILCTILFIGFFKKEKVVHLTLGKDTFDIKFWLQKRSRKDICHLIEKIEKQKQYVYQYINNPEEEVFVFMYPDSIGGKDLIYFVAISLLPMLIFKKIWLSVLALLPISWFCYKHLILLKHPIEYRKAVKAYRRRNWDEAISLLEKLIIHSPDYEEGIKLLVSMYVYDLKFDEALNMLQKLVKMKPEDIQKSKNDILLCQRIYNRRKEIIQ